MSSSTSERTGEPVALTDLSGVQTTVKRSPRGSQLVELEVPDDGDATSGQQGLSGELAADVWIEQPEHLSGHIVGADCPHALLGEPGRGSP